jgi:hypothetical protein
MVDILIRNEMGQPVAVGVTQAQINAPILQVTNLDPANLIQQGVDYQVGADHAQGPFIPRACTALNRDAATATFTRLGFMENATKVATEVPIDTLDVVAQSYYNQTHAKSVRMAEVRSLFRYHEEPIFKAENDNEPAPGNIMDIIEKGKKAPAATSIAAVPSDVSQNDLQNLQDISLLDTYVSVYSSAYLYKRHPQPYDITNPKEAAAFTKDLANARFLVITKGLPGLLIAGESSQQSFSKSTTAADLHLEFLNEMFGSFGFSPSALKKLDSILTDTVKKLTQLKVEVSGESQTLDHLISTYFFEEVQGLGIKVPKIRLFYLHIEQSSWKASVGKSSVNRFKFTMNYADYTFTMSLTEMPDMREPIKAYIKDATKRNLEDIQKMVAMDAVPKD